MYIVKGFYADYLFTRRRESFKFARQEALRNGSATWSDTLGIEEPIHFESFGKRVRICTCTAEVRLLRAIFNENHPKECSK